MIKVKEFLDTYFFSVEESTCELKNNGHYKVFGTWLYPDSEFNDMFHIRCSCNNETLRIDIINKYGKEGIYGYFQTYEHIPRGEPDINGYYQRSTDEEIINYIKSYLLDHIREDKLSKIIDDKSDI